MVRHFDALVAYLRDHDWVPNPKHASEDPILGINTFLNGLVGLGIALSPEGNTGLAQRTRKITFELDMPDAPRSSSGIQLPKPMHNRNKPVEAVTTKTFSGSPYARLAVPWPGPAETFSLPVEWCGIIPVLDHEVMRYVAAHCAPWWWMWNPVPLSPEHQSWYTNHIYQAMNLSAKLSALRGHNFLITKALSTFTTVLASAAAAAVPLAQQRPSNYPHTASTRDFNQIILIHETQKRLLATMELVLHHSQEIRRLIHLIQTLLHQLLTNLPASSPPPPPDAGEAKGGGPVLTSPIQTLTTQAPALLHALAALDTGVDRFAHGMRIDTAQLLFAAHTALEEGMLLRGPPPPPPPPFLAAAAAAAAHKRAVREQQQQMILTMGLSLKMDLQRVRRWYAEVFTTRASLAGVRPDGQLAGQRGEEAWEKVRRMGRWFVKAEGMYGGWCVVVGGLMGGVREMTRRV
ncbi:hypothetical protein C8A00DRAFT_35829 [Chaetomidium leptoderma]|uniref:Uncharacterized protein n=1 Tax=Chaetomidium leptoderma TaxID=669021 RepID=A0AAN6VH94_9PEZI|nr:hypothetical protein C8A00DRAFT_35829 [Chaetomidium leptoderma]